MASVLKLAESSQGAAAVTPPTIIPPLVSFVANEATTIGDVASHVVVDEALASVVPPSTIVPPTIVGNEATASIIGDVAFMGPTMLVQRLIPMPLKDCKAMIPYFGPTSTTFQNPAPQTPIHSWSKHMTSRMRWTTISLYPLKTSTSRAYNQSWRKCNRYLRVLYGVIFPSQHTLLHLMLILTSS